MDERGGKIVLAVLLAAALGVAVYLARSMPGMFGNTAYIGALIFLQLLIVAVWNYRRWFFLFLMIGFLWAGLDVPMNGAWVSGRWVLLAVGAIAGFVVFMSQRHHRYGAFHLLAGTAVLAAFVSAMVSDLPSLSLSKAVSLLLLFLYAGSGGRTAILGRERDFASGLLVASEVAVYATAIAYFALGQEPWGNTNSLGLAMGIVSGILLWGILISQSRAARGRRSFAFTLGITLLIFSNSRASILSSAVTMGILCISLRKNRLLFRGIAITVCLASVFAIFAPSKLANFMSESSETLIYKGHREGGVLGSRQSPWQQTMRSVRQHPWFGTGFGTSAVEQGPSEVGTYFSNQATLREHGSSYFEILEWAGYVGVLPFLGLVLVLCWHIARVARWLHRQGNLGHPIVPMMLVLLTGLLHAGFEDWLFAVGYYAAVFFWTLAFSFIDLSAALADSTVRVPNWTHAPVAAPNFGMATPGR